MNHGPAKHITEDERAVIETYVSGLKSLNAKQRFDLGMWISSRFLEYGQTREETELAEFTGVRRQAINHIYQRALKKCRLRSLAVVAKEHLIK